MAKAADDSTPISAQAGAQSVDPSTQIDTTPTLGTIAVSQVVRIVAALPLHQFMPLNDAFVQAKSRRGSGELAARELTQHARARRLTVAARRVLSDGTEQDCILRRVFWQHYAIERRSPYDDIRIEEASVRGPGRLPGRYWFFFVGRRRFERLYFTAAPNKPAAQQPLSKQSQQQDDRRLTLVPEEPQFEELRKWRPKQAMQWLAEKIKDDPPKLGDRSAWARRCYPEMQKDFGEDIPWDSWESLRRRMNDI